MQIVRARSLIGENTHHSRELRAHFDRIERTPSSHTIKGMYVAGIQDTMRSLGMETDSLKIQQFKDYPIRDFMETLLDATVTVFPKKTVAEGLKVLGEQAIPTFAASIVGSVIMGTVGRSWSLALKCVSRGYEVSLKPGRAVVAEIGNGKALVELRDVWNFGESYQVGVISGLMQWCGLNGEIQPIAKSQCDVDLQIVWVEASPKASKRKLDNLESQR
jgi:uncharacterized protein (TIGR02265 family)